MVVQYGWCTLTTPYILLRGPPRVHASRACVSRGHARAVQLATWDYGSIYSLSTSFCIIESTGPVQYVRMYVRRYMHRVCTGTGMALCTGTSMYVRVCRRHTVLDLLIVAHYSANVPERAEMAAHSHTIPKVGDSSRRQFASAIMPRLC